MSNIERARLAYADYMEINAAKAGHTLADGERDAVLRGDRDKQHGVQIALHALENADVV